MKSHTYTHQLVPYLFLLAKAVVSDTSHPDRIFTTNWCKKKKIERKKNSFSAGSKTYYPSGLESDLVNDLGHLSSLYLFRLPHVWFFQAPLLLTCLQVKEDDVANLYGINYFLILVSVTLLTITIILQELPFFLFVELRLSNLFFLFVLAQAPGTRKQQYILSKSVVFYLSERKHSFPSDEKQFTNDLWPHT